MNACLGREFVTCYVIANVYNNLYNYKLHIHYIKHACTYIMHMTRITYTHIHAIYYWHNNNYIPHTPYYEQSNTR